MYDSKGYFHPCMLDRTAQGGRWATGSEQQRGTNTWITRTHELGAEWSFSSTTFAEMAILIEENHHKWNVKLNQRHYKGYSRTRAGISCLKPPAGIRCPSSATTNPSNGNSMNRSSGTNEEGPPYPLRLETLADFLKGKLRSDKRYRITTEEEAGDQSISPKDGKTKARQNPKLQNVLCGGEVSNLPSTIEDFLDLGCDKRYDSAQWNFALEQTTLQFKLQLAGHVREDLRSFICHRLGHYLLEHLVSFSEELKEETIGYCKSHLDQLVGNEYSSRVMQVLVSRSNNFNMFVLEFFKSDLMKWMDKLSAIFLLSKCIKVYPDDVRYRFIRIEMVGKLETILATKYFKRVLVTYIENCSGSETELVYSHLQIESKLILLLNDKYFVYIYLALLHRGFEPFIIKFIQAIQDSLHNMLSTDYFKLLLIKIIKRKDHPIHQSLNTSLFAAFTKVKGSDQSVLSLNGNRLDYYLCCYAILATFPSGLYAAQQEFANTIGFIFKEPLIRTSSHQTTRLRKNSEQGVKNAWSS